MPNVLSFNLGADPAGISGGIARAFRNDREWHVRSLVSKVNYIDYPAPEPFDRRAVVQAWGEADVVHLHHDFRSFDLVHQGWAGSRLESKPFVVEFHGQRFRKAPWSHLIELVLNDAIGLASTLDLYLLGPERLEWAPAPVNVEAMQAMKQPSGERVLIAHAPTNPKIKSTYTCSRDDCLNRTWETACEDSFAGACKRLIAEGYPIEVDIIQNVPWAECLRRKAKADIYFDQVILGYGCNALEAWGMGIPVVAGAADATLDEMERRFGRLPFYHATQDTIYDALKELVEDPELRAEYGRIGHEYVRKYHDEPVVVEQLKRIYRRAMGESTQEEAA